MNSEVNWVVLVAQVHFPLTFSEGLNLHGLNFFIRKMGIITVPTSVLYT